MQTGRPQPEEAWAVGAAYERYVGRWSRLVAHAFLDWLVVPMGSRWLDVGSGTGALTAAILEMASPRQVKGVDASSGFVAHARELVRDDRAWFEVGDAVALPEATGVYDAAVSGLVLNFVPRAGDMVAEMGRCVRAGGTAAAYVWDYADGMQMMRHFWDAAVTLDPSAQPLDQGRRFPLCRPEPLTDLWRAVGLQDIAVQAIDVPTVFRDFDDYWTPFLGGQGSAPGYVSALTEAQRQALAQTLRVRLPTALDGSIRLMARAWAVRGVCRNS